MAVMGILFPAVLHYTHTEVRVGKSELSLSRLSSCIMLVAYVAYLFFQLKSQRSLYVSVNEVGSLISSFLVLWLFDVAKGGEKQGLGVELRNQEIINSKT